MLIRLCWSAYLGPTLKMVLVYAMFGAVMSIGYSNDDNVCAFLCPSTSFAPIKLPLFPLVEPAENVGGDGGRLSTPE